jgi:Ca2+-binding EF-hand superfamily protein
MLYRVQVPPGVQPGQFFTINAQGNYVKVRCPVTARAGQTIEVEVPPQAIAPQQQQQAHQQQSPYGHQPPPPTHHTPPPGAYQQPPPNSGYPGHAAPGYQQPYAPNNYHPQQHPQQQQQQQQPPAANNYPQQQQQQPHHAPPPPPTPAAYDPNTIFRDADSTHKGYITAQDLQGILARSGFPTFKLRTCALMVNLFDGVAVRGQGRITQPAFVELWKYIEDWKRVFDLHDSNGSKTIDKQELEDSVRQFGYRFSSAFVARLLSIYDDHNNQVISFDDYIQLFCELHTLTGAFQKYDTNHNGTATFQYEEFINAAYSIRM